MTSAPDLLVLPGRTVTCFVGDVHLGDGGRNDAFGAKDGLLVGFLRDCERSCDAIVFMGDMIDLAQGWSTRRVLTAHPEVARAVESASQHVQVVFVRGNHDWTVDYATLFPNALAVEHLVIGDMLVQHGHQHDIMCEPHTRSYQAQIVAHHLVERAFGFEFRTPLHEHDTLQNRAAHWIGHHYGRHLARKASRFRRRGLEARAVKPERFVDYWSRSVWGDPHDAFRSIAAMVRNGPYRAVVCGHTHLPGVVELDGRCYVNAGSWAFGAAQAAAWDGTVFSGHDIATGTAIGDEHYRWMGAGHDPGDFFDWWAQHYQGRLRFGPPVPAAEAAALCVERASIASQEERR